VLGFDGTPPGELLERGRAEFERFGGEVILGTVVTAAAIDGRFDLVLADGDRHLARAVVVATGVTDELPTVPGLAEQWGRGVVICPYCDGWEIRGGRVGILATGRKSISQAQLLRQWSEHVIFFANGSVTLSPSEQVEFAARNIEVVDELVVGIEAVSDGRVAVRTHGNAWELEIIFTAPRVSPNDHLLRELGADTVQGGPAILVDARGATSVPGLWAAGNVVDASLKVPTALGNGMSTGTHVNEALVRADILHAVAGSRDSGE
jgi:thioredoxin reductase